MSHLRTQGPGGYVWEPQQPKPQAAADAAGDEPSTLVKYPASLEWVGLACQARLLPSPHLFSLCVRQQGFSPASAAFPWSLKTESAA